MKLSIIIPAFNEEKRLARCLTSVRQALEANACAEFEAEIIVADNNSTDATAAIAREHGARVVFEPVNQIARARNAGAAVATGDWFLFFDADSSLPAGAVGDMLKAIETGKVAGGGSTLVFDKAPIWLRAALALGNLAARVTRLTAGCFIFCRAAAFRELGGFSHELYAAEDAQFGWTLRRWARDRGMDTVLLHRNPPVTSSRKLELYSKREILMLLGRFLLLPKRTLRNQAALAFFYDGRR
jgi:glycosyltransferase involved in cell wall biosynthesis